MRLSRVVVICAAYALVLGGVSGGYMASKRNIQIAQGGGDGGGGSHNNSSTGGVQMTKEGFCNYCPGAKDMNGNNNGVIAGGTGTDTLGSGPDSDPLTH